MNCSMQDSMDTPRGPLTKGSGVGAWPLALALLCLTGCPEGLDRPAPTALKLITGGTFKLGPPRLDKAGNPSKTGKIPLKCGGKDSIPTDRCDSGDTHDPLLWIDKLTWVPNATAHVKTFKIERHEVTNLQYRYCVEKGACDEPDLKQVGGVEYYGASEYDDHPVVYVSREDAQRYCAFIGRKLPTEAQWERAARLEKSLKVVRTYPYESHSEPDCSKNNKRRIVSQGCSQIPLPVGDSAADVTDLGVMDMASNVSEWVRDDWNPYSYCKDKTTGFGQIWQAHNAWCTKKTKEQKSYDPANKLKCPQWCQREGEKCDACKLNPTLCARSCQPGRLAICLAGTYRVYTGNATEFVVRGGSYRQSRCFTRLYVRRKGSARSTNDIGFRCVLEDAAAGPDAGKDMVPDQPQSDAGGDSSADLSLLDSSNDTKTSQQDAPPPDSVTAK